MSVPRGAARSALALWLCVLCSVATAVNLVYDEVLWTKNIWSSAKVSNMLLYTNPTDQDPKLLEVYPSVRGALANSLDGPNKRRDASARPAETDGLSDGFEGLHGLATISEANDIKPAAQAAQCSVCHVLMVQVWQNLTNQAVDDLLQRPPSGWTSVATKQAVKEQLLETCKKGVGEVLLSKQAILRLDETRANLVFYVLRGRQQGGKPSVTEHRAVRVACKNLMTEAGDDMANSLQDMLGMFLSHLKSVLEKEGLLEGPAAADGADGDGADAAGGSGISVGAAARAAKLEHQRLQLVSLVKQVLRTVWPEPGADPGAVPDAKAAVADEDEYEDGDEDDMDPDCMDLHPMCQSWADKGECEANPNYMVGGPNHKGHCKKSCGVCLPKKKGEQGVQGLVDSSELRAQHPGLADRLEQLLKPLQQALCSSACGASRACLNGATGMSTGDGFAQATATVQQANAPWQLEKPHYGAARVDTLPPSVRKALESASAGHAPVEPGSLAAEVDSALSAELKGKVLSVPGDFFIYEYVYKNHTRHYHAEGDGRFTEDYMLGSFKRESVDMISAATGSRSVLEERDLLPNMHGTMVRQDWPYVKQVYAGGDECVLGGGRRAVRKTEARIACSPDQEVYMLVREPDFCQYVFVIYSPALCTVERFKPQPKPAPKLPDDDSDEEYLD